MLERIMKEIRRRTRVVGAFPDGQSALMLVAPGYATSPARTGAQGVTSTWTASANRRSEKTAKFKKLFLQRAAKTIFQSQAENQKSAT
ncbi:hypothetical protein DSM3645_15190 [Blastopirellula marina DSM 3645]|uniref:Uncharacterized protein n=1 Tax=Blastopirellula marina DSM 3645 TaxID=314230 RepID=A4A257_9BACT|nr:hypothetical protein DSM3645_15190 [Blastopirellula marina DSM 3645]